MDTEAYMSLARKFYLQVAQPGRTSCMPSIFLLDSVHRSVWLCFTSRARIKQAVDKVRTRHQLHPASHLMSDFLHSRSLSSARACCNPAWSHCSSLLALVRLFLLMTSPWSFHDAIPCPLHPLCSPRACFLFPRFFSRIFWLQHFIIFLSPAGSSLMPKLLVSIRKPWSYSCFLPLSQALYLELLSVFTPLNLRALPSSHVWLCA